MKAMILAAGKGTRVRPITYSIPKPMIPILNKPVMEFLVELLSRHGFDEIMVNTSHLGYKIENYFQDGQRFGVNMAYSCESQLVDGEMLGSALGSAGGMMRVQTFNRFFDDTFVVLCGDALVDVDLTEAVRWHREKGSMATVIMKTVPMEEVSSYGVMVTDESGKIQSFQEKPSPEEALSNDISTGIYIFEPEIFDHIPANQPYDIGGELFPKLLELGLPFYGYAMDFQWVDIGKVPDYWEAMQQVMRGEVNNVSIPGKEIAPGVYVGLNVSIDLDRVDIEGPVYISGMTCIEPGAKIVGPTVIGSNCHVSSGTVIDKSIIFEYSRLAQGVHLKNQLVFGKYCVDQLGNSVNMEESELDWLITDTRLKPSYLRSLQAA